jgi:hypothetical protein
VMGPPPPQEAFFEQINKTANEAAEGPTRRRCPPAAKAGERAGAPVCANTAGRNRGSCGRFGAHEAAHLVVRTGHQLSDYYRQA